MVEGRRHEGEEAFLPLIPSRTVEAENFLKNEATDLLDNKGSALGKIRNEATVGARRRGSDPKTRWLDM